MTQPKPPRRLRRDEQQRHIRAQLLDAAERVFARQGYQGASIQAIAAEAGYSHGAIYSNFNGKEDLFLVLQQEREAYLLLVDFRNQAVRDPTAAAKFAERHARLRTLIGRIVEGIVRDQ